MGMNGQENRKLAAMHLHYGSGWPERCEDCTHLVGVTPTSRHLYKCEAYGDTRSEATDWAKRWTACGLINKDDISELTTMIEQLKHAPRKPVEEPIAGQISVEEVMRDGMG